MYKKYAEELIYPCKLIHLFRPGIIMRLCFVLLIISLQISVFAHAQQITINKSQVPLGDLIREIKKQSGYNIYMMQAH
ncbi:hypothetical protein SAMN05216436_12325 [bacterium A37T11]|nr:hypothetical protein SAMN05216436_12325 [bacterium A37T11]